MARNRRPLEEPAQDLNLTPIMNMVMILIPLLAMSAIFMKAGVINISSPRNAQSAAAPEEQDTKEQEVPVPQVFVAIAKDGFRVQALNAAAVPEFAPFAAPVSRCAGRGGASDAPPTICTLDGVSDSEALVKRLDYASLYNRLVEIRTKPEWFEAFKKEGKAVISITADPDVPYEVLVRTMDAARFFLKVDGTTPPAPSASSGAAPYQLPGDAPTQESLMRAKYLTVGEGGKERVTMFPDPVLLMARPQSGG